MDPELAQAAVEMFEGLYNLRDANKFNFAVGFFQKYTVPAVESDSYGKFYCDIKLHYKDDESNDVSALNVPLFYIGGSNGALYFELVKGDELLVVFSDRTLENWKPTSGTIPQGIGNPVKDSINHAIAIPIISAHKAAEVIDPPVDSEAIALRSRPGGKVESGNGTDDVPKLLDQVITQFIKLVDSTILGGSNPVDLGGTSSTGALFKIEGKLSDMKDDLDDIQTALGNIKV